VGEGVHIEPLGFKGLNIFRSCFHEPKVYNLNYHNSRNHKNYIIHSLRKNWQISQPYSANTINPGGRKGQKANHPYEIHQ
jgi:hypothetical protein